MTDFQFQALAELLSLRTGPAREAARLVLVEGVPVGSAAVQAGCSQPSASNALARCRRGMELARRVVG